jgi:hypothetical protein
VPPGIAAAPSTLPAEEDASFETKLRLAPTPDADADVVALLNNSPELRVAPVVTVVAKIGSLGAENASDETRDNTNADALTDDFIIFPFMVVKIFRSITAGYCCFKFYTLTNFVNYTYYNNYFVTCQLVCYNMYLLFKF